MNDSLSLKNERFLGKLRRTLIVEDYTKGIPVAEIAAKYGVAASTVSNAARRAGLGRNANLAGARVEVVKAYAAGTPVNEIAKTFKVDRKSIWVWVTKAGLQLRRPRMERKP